MKVLMLAPGSRGDVAPAAGLGASFVADGHEAIVVAGAEYGELVTEAGCTHAPIDARLTPDLDGNGEGAGVRAHLAALRSYMDAAASAALVAADGAEAVIANTISPYGHDIAEGLGVPSAEALLQPSYPSGAYPPMVASARDLGRIGNRLAGRLAQRVKTPYDPACARVRSELGLPPEGRRVAQARRRREGMPVHHGISAAVLPRPSEWPAELTLDGFWWPPARDDWSAPEELRAFLGSGPAPVVVTLGSMPGGPRVADAITEGLRTARVRAVLQGSDLVGVPSRLDAGHAVHAGDVPHEWLFPQCSAVVHHAGAGVSSAALRAGVPSVPLPMHTDQPFWARRLASLSAATAPVPLKKVTADVLADLIRTATTSERLREGAQGLRDALATEDGTLPLRSWLRSLGMR